MANSSMLTKVYSIGRNSSIRAEGYAWRDANSCREYFGERVASRLKEGNASEFLREYLDKMPDTGFTLTHLRIEAEQDKPARDWEIGEAFAESMLEDYFDCLFPWPTSRDQREKEGYATGPDLPGYNRHSTGSARFAFGEVKSSSQEKSPPSVISGVDGKAGKGTMVGQLRRLLTEGSRRKDLIAWLGFRETRDETGKSRFDQAIKRYGEGRECLVAGCLICGKRPEGEADLAEAHAALESEVAGRELWLFAFYLPFKKDEWPSLVTTKGGQS